MGVGLCIIPNKTNKELESNKLFNQNLYNINSSITKYAPKQKIKSNNLSNLKNKNKKVIIKNENSSQYISTKSSDTINNEEINNSFKTNFIDIQKKENKVNTINNFIYNDDENFPTRIKDEIKLNYIQKENISGLIITNYTQKIILTKNGQKIKHIIILKQVNLKEGIISHKWTFSINSKTTIVIKKVKLNGKYEFKSNTFTFEFDLENEESIKISFTYFEIRENLLEYYRHLRVNIPNFFYGTVCHVIIKIPLFFKIISQVNNLFTEDLQENIFLFDGIIPKDGITEIFKLSIKKAKWKGKICQHFYLKRDIFPLIIYSNKFFQCGFYKFLKYDIFTSNIDNEKIIEEEKFFKFYYQDDQILEGNFTFKTIFENDIEENYIINDIENKIKKFENNEEYNFFKNLSEKILFQNKVNIPNYIKLGKWVNSFLKYNPLLTNKKIPIEEIIKIKEGVGEHFTLLYNMLLNSIGISSIFVNGLSHNCENGLIEINSKFINHAWTLSKINNKWIPLDCTFGFFDGKLPISHIFLNYLEYDIPENENIEKENLKYEIVYLNEQ